MELYVARDENEMLFLYLNKPERDLSVFIPKEYLNRSFGKKYFMAIPKNAFPAVTWENSPVKVTLNLLEWPEQKK